MVKKAALPRHSDYWRFRFSRRSTVISAVTVALFVILSLIAAATPASIVYPIESAHFGGDGFWPPEHNGERIYRWTKGQAQVHLPGLEGTSLLRVAVQLSAPQQPEQASVAALVTTNTGLPLHFDIASEWRTYHFLIRAQPSNVPAFTIITDTWRSPGDRRDLGILLGQLRAIRLLPPHDRIIVERWLFLASLAALITLISWRIRQIGFIVAALAPILVLLALWAPDRFIRLLPTNWCIPAILMLIALIIESIHRYQRNTPPKNYVLAPFLFAYLTAGLFTQLNFLSIINPVFLQDFNHYERALQEALSGKGPYNDFIIGSAYLYPPPALFVVEVFHIIDPFLLRASVYSALNVLLMTVMIYKLPHMYGYQIDQTWYWYILCLGFAPFLELLQVGQINMITLFGIFVFFYFTSSPFIGSLGLSLAVITKFSPAMFLVYLFARKRWKNFIITIFVLTLLVAAGQFRYKTSILEYFSIIQWLTDQFVINSNSQSLVSRIFMMNYQLQSKGILFMGFLTDYRAIQRIINFYIAIIIILTNLVLFSGKSSKEPAFIITGLGTTLLPNIMWYHHYVFLLLPIFVWVCWKKFDNDVVKWCLTGLFIIQIDRFHLTNGLLVHVFGHVSMIWVLHQQITEFIAAKSKIRVAR
ncbi:MAG: glycosyltransferase family 87 protein [Roseiflexaceae bacterium]|nr:glycosyltransferase family 87 protein [Roseiflexaceae bacterium]